MRLWRRMSDKMESLFLFHRELWVYHIFSFVFFFFIKHFFLNFSLSEEIPRTGASGWLIWPMAALVLGFSLSLVSGQGEITWRLSSLTSHVTLVAIDQSRGRKKRAISRARETSMKVDDDHRDVNDRGFSIRLNWSSTVKTESSMVFDRFLYLVK